MHDASSGWLFRWLECPMGVCFALCNGGTGPVCSWWVFLFESVKAHEVNLCKIVTHVSTCRFCPAIFGTHC